MLIKLSVVFGGGQLEGMRSCYFEHTHIQHSVSFVLFKLAIEENLLFFWFDVCEITCVKLAIYSFFSFLWEF